MRLICTNCDAQYEVDDSVIPDGGRDVQCSNCGHAWFQPGRFSETAERGGDTPDGAEQDGGALAAPAVSKPADGFAGDEYAEDEDVPPPEPMGNAGRDVFGDDDAAPGGSGGAEPEPEPAPEPAVAVPSRHLDDDMLAILREEAERETRARRSEGSDLQFQPDLNLPEAQPVRSATYVEAAEAGLGGAGFAGDEQVADLSDASDDGPRGKGRELLPDIETINSTLRASNGRVGDGDTTDEPELRARERGGFRLGFSISLIAAVILLALYVLAPSLAQQVPALSPALTAYVGTINEARMWIDEFMRSSTEAMRGS